MHRCSAGAAGSASAPPAGLQQSGGAQSVLAHLQARPKAACLINARPLARQRGPNLDVGVSNCNSCARLELEPGHECRVGDCAENSCLALRQGVSERTRRVKQRFTEQWIGTIDGPSFQPKLPGLRVCGPWRAWWRRLRLGRAPAGIRAPAGAASRRIELQREIATKDNVSLARRASRQGSPRASRRWPWPCCREK